MKTLCITLTMLLFSLVHSSAKDESIDKPTATAKKHITAILSLDIDTLKNTYADSIRLMPGHEFTKDDYQLAPEGSRKTGATVKRDQLLAAMSKDVGDRPKPPADKVKKRVDSLNYEILKTKAGDFATDPADPVGTADGKLHFNIQKDDVLIKVSPPRGDFLLVQLRKLATGWQIVAEYLD